MIDCNMKKKKQIDAKLAESLRKLRVLRNFSQEVIADELGIAVSTYTRMEGGKIGINFLAMEKLAGFYGMSIDEMRDFEQNTSRKVQENTVLEGSKAHTITLIVELDGSELSYKNAINRIDLVHGALRRNSL